ncbi:MAG: hypothetical protein ABIZ81_16975 [Opitutaceae bacterium]
MKNSFLFCPPLHFLPSTRKSSSVATLGSRWISRALLLGALTVVRAAAAETDSDDVVVLPSFQVLDTRPWFYASVPGFEILSLENERETRRIALELQRAGRFMPWFFPAGSYGEPEAKSVLFIDRFSSGRTLNEAGVRLKVAKVDLFSLGGADGVIQFASAQVVSTWLSGRRSPARLWFSNLAQLIRPSVPHWYREGVGDLLNAAKVSETKLEFSGQRVDVSSFLPLAELLAVRTQPQAIEMTNATPGWRGRYHGAATLFVRWGLFSDAGIRRTSFVEFAASGSNADEAALQRYFGLTPAELQLSLQGFAEEGGRRSLSLALPKSRSPVTLVPIVAHPATETEVARIVGSSYLALARQTGISADSRERYRTMTRKTLGGTGVDRQDPRLQVVLGTQEFLDQNFSAARALIEAARRAGVATPYVYYLEAALRLRAIDFETRATGPLSPADADIVLETLRAGMKLFPRSLDSYRLMAEVHLRHEDTVRPDDLALLLTGTREYPENVSLLSNTALLYFRNGRSDVAAELVTRGLASAGIDQTPQKATLLGLRRKLQEDAGITAAPTE